MTNDFIHCWYLILRYLDDGEAYDSISRHVPRLHFFFSTCNPSQSRSSTEVFPPAKNTFSECVSHRRRCYTSVRLRCWPCPEIWPHVSFWSRTCFLYLSRLKTQHKQFEKEKVRHLDVAEKCFQNEVFFHSNLCLCNPLSIGCMSKGDLFYVHRTESWVCIHMDATMYDAIHFSSFHTSVMSYTVIAQEKIAFDPVAKRRRHTYDVVSPPKPFDCYIVSPKFVQHWCPYFRDKKTFHDTTSFCHSYVPSNFFPLLPLFQFLWCFLLIGMTVYLLFRVRLPEHVSNFELTHLRMGMTPEIRHTNFIRASLKRVFDQPLPATSPTDTLPQCDSDVTSQVMISPQGGTWFIRWLMICTQTFAKY